MGISNAKLFLNGRKFCILSVIYCLLLLTPNTVNCQVSLLQRLANNIGIVRAPQTSSGPNTYRQTLDPRSNLTLAWTVNRGNRTITLTIESDRRGYVALALTRQGVLESGDVVVVGAEGENGAPYVLDMHGVSNDTIAEDINQDWRLLSSVSTESGVSISIQRNLDACDDQDISIREELITVLLAHGNDSNLTRFESEGERKIFFLDPHMLPQSSNVNVTEFQRWRVARQYELPPRQTSYWCSIHKMQPSLPNRHHVTGFSPYFANEVAERHVHHQILYRCTAPPGTDPETLFEPFLNFPGEECYVNEAPVLPSVYCRDMIHIFGIGGEPVLFPESWGLQIGGETNSYFMFETHYDNPNRTEGIVVDHGVDIYHTPELRPETGSILLVGYGPIGTFVVPPRASDFSVAGHCSKECSQQIIPLGGLDVVGVMLHGHTSTRRVRLRQFRGSNELPWILSDDEFDFQYQQIRMLDEPRRILPGDQLTTECGYDTNWKNGSAVASGFSTRDEMCTAFLLVNKPLPFAFCSSEYSTDKTMARYGIRNMTWDLHLHERVIREASDPTIVGITLSQVVERENWTQERMQQLENEQLYSSHLANCPNLRMMGGFYYYATGFNNLTGVLPSSLLNQGMPGVTVIRTALPLPVPVQYPQNVVPYTPPAPLCRAEMQMNSTSNSNMSTQIQGISQMASPNQLVQNGNMIGTSSTG